MKKGILALQFWDGDKKKAMSLARLIADIEPVRRDDVDFVFIARADCDHDPATVEYVSRKFNVRKLKCMVHGAGHPRGCWVLWFSIVEWFYKNLLLKNAPPYKWIFPFEADCVPSSKNWINECHEDFLHHDTCLVGAEWLHGQHHINGNMMVSSRMDFLKWLTTEVSMSGVPVHEPWDVYLFPKFSQWGVGFSEKIINCYARRTMSRAEFQDFQKQGLAFIHGTKDDSASYWARELLIQKLR